MLLHDSCLAASPPGQNHVYVGQKIVIDGSGASKSVGGLGSCTRKLPAAATLLVLGLHLPRMIHESNGSISNPTSCTSLVSGARCTTAFDHRAATAAASADHGMTHPHVLFSQQQAITSHMVLTFAR